MKKPPKPTPAHMQKLADLMDTLIAEGVIFKKPIVVAMSYGVMA